MSILAIFHTYMVVAIVLNFYFSNLIARDFFDGIVGPSPFERMLFTVFISLFWPLTLIYIALISDSKKKGGDQ